ncbi:MAG: hypothetical protein WA858_24680 [Xanthobacteraceae bacterium]
MLAERAPIVADGFNLAAELGLILRRCAFLRADRVEFLIALFERFRIGLRRGGRRRRR